MLRYTGFFWILIISLIYGIIHSVFASQPVKKWIAVQFGIINSRLYRLIYVLQSLFFTFIYISLIFLFPDRLLYVISSPWRYFTLLIQAGAIIGVYLSLRQTGILAFLGLDFLLARPGFVPPDHLSTGGIYRYARHPLYTFSLIFIWLLPIMTWNILAWNIGVTAYVFIGSYFEEKKLIQDFGQEYLDYRNQVPAFLPVPVRKP